MENYITPTEMREIAEFCDSLQPLWESLTSVRNGISFESPSDFDGFAVFDSNGEMLGMVTWAEDGAAFYPTKSQDD